MIDWDGAADADVQEQAGYDDVPPNVWIAAETATKKNGGAAPSMALKKFNVKDKHGNTEEVRSYQFNVGLLVRGGDQNLDMKFKDRYAPFFRVRVHPWEGDEDEGPRGLLNGRLVGFLNAVFATGIALDEKDTKVRSKKRWQATLEVLKKLEPQHPEMTEDSAINELTGEVDLGLLIVQFAIAALDDEGRMLMFKTGLSKKRPGRDQVVEIKQFEDFVRVNAEKRGVRVFADDGLVVPATAAIPGF